MMTKNRPLGARIRACWAYPEGVYRGALVLFLVASILLAFSICQGIAIDRVFFLGLDVWGLGACLSWAYLNSFAPLRPKRSVFKEVLCGGSLFLLFVGLVRYFMPDSVRPHVEPVGDRLEFSAACMCLLFAVKVPSRGTLPQRKMVLDEVYPLRLLLFMTQVFFLSCLVAMLTGSAVLSGKGALWSLLPFAVTVAAALTLCPAYVLWRMRGALEKPEPMHDTILAVASLVIPFVAFLSLRACFYWQREYWYSGYGAGFLGWLTFALLPPHVRGPYPVVNRIVQLFRTFWPRFFVLPLVLRGVYLASAKDVDLTRFGSFYDVMWLSAYLLGCLGVVLRRPPARPLIMKTFAFLVAWTPLCRALSAVWRGCVRPLLGV